MIVIEAK